MATQKLTSIDKTYLDAARANADQTLWSVLVACAVLAVFTITIFMMFSLSLNKALKSTNATLLEVSKGDLSIRMAKSSNEKDEFNQLANAINQSCENLGELVSAVQLSSDDLSSNAAELNVGLDSLAKNQSDVLGQNSTACFCY